MSTFTVNGNPVTVEIRKKLIFFLRDDLHLKSVKNGCNEGACGTCTILVDGKATKACVLYTDKLNEKNIVTVEGLSKREKDVFSYAFAFSGAVQCGFCIPGMVICAKGLIDKNPDPSSEDVKTAIKNNICRCTGYVKIEKAILLAAKMLRNNEEVPQQSVSGLPGDNLMRIDAMDKALGTAEYVDDMEMEGMAYGSAIRPPFARCRILSIDTSKAKSLPGVLAVLTAADVPGTPKIGHIQQDWDVMIPVGEITHFLGDAVALVAAETKEILEEAKKLVEVQYEELPGCFSPTDSLAENAPLIHETGNLLSSDHIVRGNVEEAIHNAKYVVENHYSTPFTEHAFLEPESAVGIRTGTDTITVYSGDQGIYQTQAELSQMLNLPREKVRIVAKMVGGGFGGKEDMSVQHHAALLAWHLPCPVNVTLSRQESMLIHPKRHPFEMDVLTACDENGYLTAMKAVLIGDTGAYASLGGPVVQRACTHAAGPYNYQNVDILGKAVYTNNPPSGAFRGFGVTQSCFALECNLNQLAEKVGISPWEIRYRNAIRPGQVLPNGQFADESTALVETLEAIKEFYHDHPKSGIACCMKNSGVGVGLPDIGRCRLEVKEGKVYIYSSAACIGQGLGTIMIQMIKHETNLPLEKLLYQFPDTALSPNSGTTTASRQTLFTGEATRRAAAALAEALKGKTLEDLNGQEFFQEYSGVTDQIGSEKPNPISHIAYGYATHVVELDEEGKVKLVIAAHDIGKAINPINIEGQIEGGVVMSLGYTLTEDFPVENGHPTKKFGTLGLFKAPQIPQIQSILVGKSTSILANGAKGVGEISAIPTTPAIQLAYYNRDGKFRTSLPLEDTPYSKK